MDSKNHQLIDKIVIKLGLLLTVAVLNTFYFRESAPVSDQILLATIIYNFS